jgi:hypothetical protein
LIKVTKKKARVSEGQKPQQKARQHHQAETASLPPIKKGSTGPIPSDSLMVQAEPNSLSLTANQSCYPIDKSQEMVHAS